jgi:hypothetical protein
MPLRYDVTIGSRCSPGHGTWHDPLPAYRPNVGRWNTSATPINWKSRGQQMKASNSDRRCAAATALVPVPASAQAIFNPKDWNGKEGPEPSRGSRNAQAPPCLAPRGDGQQTFRDAGAARGAATHREIRSSSTSRHRRGRATYRIQPTARFRISRGRRLSASRTARLGRERGRKIPETPVTTRRPSA